jgi:tRNA/rRNA methyltransferase
VVPRGSGKPPEHATHEEIELFYEQLERSLLKAGFLNPRNPKKLMARLRRLFGRAQLEQEEVNILHGVIKTLATPKKYRH